MVYPSYFEDDGLLVVDHRGALGLDGSATVRGSKPSHLLSLQRAVRGANLLQEKQTAEKSEHNAYQLKDGKS